MNLFSVVGLDLQKISSDKNWDSDVYQVKFRYLTMKIHIYGGGGGFKAKWNEIC